MENFEKYFIEESSDHGHRYFVIDSEVDLDNSSLLQCVRPKNNYLHSIDLNSLSSESKECQCEKVRGVENKSKIFSFLRSQRQNKQNLECLKEQINKVSAECDALEMLIENIVKKQAELKVKKSQISRKIKKQKDEAKCEVNSKDDEKSSNSLDIKKTIKTDMKKKKI